MRHFVRSGAVVLALAVSATVATTTGAARLQPSDFAGELTPVWTPLGVGGSYVTVMVQLSGNPVAVEQANAGRKLSKAERDAIKGRLRGSQAAVGSAVAALGGTVLGQYQVAYNGIKVRVPSSKTDQLAALAGVAAVRPIQLMRPNNVNGVPLIGAPGVWQSLGLRGEGIKVAIIDTGIDYTHANFGGPGTIAAYNQAHANETQAANPAWFGPGAPRVKGGIDLVGDSYNADPASATYQPIPHPDPNPLDCNDHGSHVAGTAAGSGVLSTGVTYTGLYNASTVASNNWIIGPGVAPKADLYAIRVFGCDGSTDATVDAIEWAVDNDMDVINMSLGSPFGTADDPSAEASTNAAKAGVIVVTSAGNNGPSPYITGSPGTATGAIATAANDGTQSFPGAAFALTNGVTMNAIVANGYPLTGPQAYTVKVITDNPATSTEDESLGCSVAAFGGPLPPNTIAVVNRGVCARVAKAIFGQQAGAAAVVMVNNTTSLPPYEGAITSNPDTGVPFLVTIPFYGVRGLPTTPTSDGGKLRASNGAGLTATPIDGGLTNPTYLGFGSFSSGGPRSGDSALKPDITAPGVSVISTQNGSGNGALILSGTSMASPHVAGVAALTRQAHPTWSVEDIKASIVNTGVPSGVVGYKTSRAGTGLVQPAKSTASQVVARANGDKFAVSLNFGYAELQQDFSGSQSIKLHNSGAKPATFNIAQAQPSGASHSVGFNRTSVTVPAGGDAQVNVSLSVPVGGVASNLGFVEVAGLVEFTPASANDNEGVALRVPYYLVPRARSNVATDIGNGMFRGTNPSVTATVTNKNGVLAGDADFYAWGLSSPKVKGGKESNDVRAVGVQSFPVSASTQLVVFAVNTYQRWSNASQNEFDIYVDVDNDGVDDYIVVGVDQGAVQTGTFNGIMGSFVFSTRSAGASINFLASAPTDSSTALLPVYSSQLCRSREPCLSAANPRITYQIASFDLANGGSKAVAGSARYNVWSSAISQGGFVTVGPGQTDASTPIAINSAEWALTPAKGVMVVTFDNDSGESEAQLLDVDVKK